MTERPISPHITIYKWQFAASILSISQRATGIALAFGFVAFETSFLYALYLGESSFLLWKDFMHYCSILFLPALFTVFFHAFLCIRQVFFDMGIGFSVYKISGYAVVAFSSLSTIVTWWRVFCG